jgi:single-strand DNA-binding protein
MKQITIAGRVGRDAEIKQSKNGKTFASFSVAVDCGKDSNGEKRPSVWFDCTLWERRAEALAPHIRKGSFVVVTGDVDARAYVPNGGGEPKAVMSVRVAEFTFGGGGDEQRAAGGGGGQRQGGGYGGGQRPSGGGQQRQQAAAPPADDFGDGFGGDDEIPF